MLGLTAMIGAVSLSAPGGVHAQKATPAPLSPDFKGAVGLGMIGAELGFIVPALAGAHDAWAFIVFPVLGAAGGAVGGYYLLEQGAGHPELAVGALVAGMALFVPAMVLTISATAYEPDEDELSASAASMRAAAAAAAGPGLLRWSTRGVLLAPPMVAVGPSMDAKQAFRTGASREQAWRVSLVSGLF
jgi:hypothetical protein